MTLTKKPQTKHFYYIGFISALILACYSNTFHASWHLDDLPNIVANPSLHLNELSFSSLASTLTANPTRHAQDALYRPIPMFSFAINWFISKENVLTYHIVNILIHIVTTSLLYLTIYHILTRTFFATKYRFSLPAAQITAILAASLWALNPIQTQAITYIVQRMASMAAMFYIMAIFFYLLARSTKKSAHKLVSYIIALLCFLLSIGSKEHCITLPIALLFIEFLFLQDIGHKKTKQQFALILLGITTMSFLLSSFFFLNENPLSALTGYDSKSFTLTERLLTEPRVVTNYLYQLFYPITSNLSLEHDITLSQSFLKPWTTLPAIFSLTLLLISALLAYRKAPFYSFAVLFFFLNHIIESTVIPLEIVFEHRNYLPSMFLFVPVAQILFQGIHHFQKSSPILSKTLLVFSVFLILTLCFSTYSRNAVWATEQTLWEDTVKKAPKSARAAHNLARWYRQHGQFKEALILFKQAEQLAIYAARPDYTKANALNGQGTIYIYTDGPQRAIQAFKEALLLYPSFTAIQQNLAVTLLKAHQWPEALKETSKLIGKHPYTIEYTYFHTIALLRNKQPQSSLAQLETALQESPNSPKLLLACAASYKALKQYQEAKKYLYQYDILNPGKLSVRFTLLEISILEQNRDMIEALKLSIQEKYSNGEIARAIAENQFIPLYSKKIIGPVLKKQD